jgi:hypothetical protein
LLKVIKLGLENVAESLTDITLPVKLFLGIMVGKTVIYYDLRGTVEFYNEPLKIGTWSTILILKF